MKRLRPAGRKKSPNVGQMRGPREIMTIAEKKDPLGGEGTQIRKHTGIDLGTDLSKVSPVKDHYVDWLFSRHGVIDPNVDLEF